MERRRPSYYRQKISRLNIQSISRNANYVKTNIMSTPFILTFAQITGTLGLMFKLIPPSRTYTEMRFLRNKTYYDI